MTARGNQGYRPLGRLGSGEVVIDRHRSHLHDPVAALVPEALGKVSASGRHIIIEQVELGRVVGKRTCVETAPGDEIIYAKRLRRKGLTRFVVGREPPDCSSVVVVLMKDAEAETYVCLSAYIGTPSEPEPWDAHATAESEEFWNTHALIWDGEEIVPGTQTEPLTL